MRRLLNLAVLLALVGVVAVSLAASGPAPSTIASGSSAVFKTLGSDGAFGGYPSLVEIKCPDADVTYSFWDFDASDSTWTRVTGRHTGSDTVGTLYSGDILRVTDRVKGVYITRSGATGGIVNRYF